MVINSAQLSDYITSQSANTLKWAQKNLIDIYSDNWGYIINSNLKVIFTEKTLEKMRPFITKEFNLLKSIVKTTSMVYKNKAIRRAITKAGTDDAVYAAAIADARIDTRMKTANKMTNLLNNVLLRPVIVNDRLRYHIIDFSNATIVQDTDDPERLIAVQFFTGLELPDYDRIYHTNIATMDYIEDFQFEKYASRIVYTIEMIAGREMVVYRKFRCIDRAFQSKAREEIIEEKQLPQYVDRKGRAKLPFTLCTADESTDGRLHFTRGYDIVDATIGIALMLTQLYHIVKYQSFKQGFIVSPADQIPAEFFSDPSAWIHIPQNAAGQSGSAGVLDTQSDYMKLWEAIKQRIVMVLAQYGINPSDFMQSGTPASGFSKLIENSKLLESREDDIPRYESFERDIYENTVMVWNSDRSPAMPAMASDAVFSIEFGRINFPVDTDAQIAEENHLMMNGILSAVDIIKRRNPGLTDDEAAQKYADNIAVNRKKGAAAQSFYADDDEDATADDTTAGADDTSEAE